MDPADDARREQKADERADEMLAAPVLGAAAGIHDLRGQRLGDGCRRFDATLGVALEDFQRLHVAAMRDRRDVKAEAEGAGQSRYPEDVPIDCRQPAHFTSPTPYVH